MKDDADKPQQIAAAPKPRRSLRRRLLRAATYVALAIGLILALHPIWQPWALRPILRQFGVEFASYDRVGYSRFALIDGAYEKGGVSFEFKRLEAPTAGAWLRARGFGNGAEAKSRPTLKLADWRLEITPTDSPPPEPTELNSTAAVLDLISSHLPEARAWVPILEATNGTVRALDEYILVPSIDWRGGKLGIATRTDRFSGDMTFEIDAARHKTFAFTAQAPTFGIRSAATLTRTDGAWPLKGTLDWQTNQVSFSALFTADGWPPKTAKILAAELRVPGHIARLDGYREIQGSLSARWADARYELIADAVAAPNADDSGLPPIVAGFSASGDLASARITRAEVNTRGLRLAQSEPLEIRFADGLTMDAADLGITLDLAQASGALVAGEVAGNIRLLPRVGELPEIRATLASDTAAWRDWKLSAAALRCSLSWPELVIQEVSAQMEDGSQFSADARIDLGRQSIVSSRWSLSGKALNRLLPEGAGCQSLEASGTVEGNFLAPTHTTRIAIGSLSLPGLATAEVDANWRGKGAEVTIDRLEWRAASSAARISGSLSLLAADAPGRAELALKTMELVKGNQTLLRLESETQLQLNADRGGWSVRSGDLRLAEGKRSFALNVALQSEGGQSIIAAARELALNDYSEFLARPLPSEIKISRLAAEASWTNGPIAFSLDANATALAPDGKPITLDVKSQGASAGVRIESLTLSGQVSQIVHAAGFAPLAIVPGAGKSALQFAPGELFDLNVTVESNRIFWSRVAEQTGVRIERPDVRLHLGGFPGTMNGTLRASFATAAWEREIGSIVPPRMDAIEIDAELNKGAATLKKASFQVEGQTVHIDGSLPIGKEFWLSLTNKPTPPNWRDGSASVRLSDVQVAAFQRYLPDTLRPQGSMNADLKWRPGGGIDGFMKLSDAATLPLPAIGPVRDIAAHVEFAGREATLKTFSGALGDEPVFVAGTISLPEVGLPQFEFSLRGTNVSLIRQPGMIVRSDLDLALSLTNGTPQLSGTATLRDSAFFQDLRVLRGKVRQSERRYPFFQIDDPALSGWKLDLRVKGDRFLQTRTPWFRGVATADFHIGGTLGAPVAPGFVRVDSGVAQFPFGYLDVSSGRATVELAAPNQMNLNVTASGSAFDYSITMKIEGSLEEPRVIFTSSPPLSSQQILLMLTAGQIPRDDIHLTSQQKAARIAVYLGKDLLARLGAEPDQADRLTIRSGENVTDQGRLSYSLEYRLTDRWSAVGEYDRFSAVNAGLKWRIYSK